MDINEYNREFVYGQHPVGLLHDSTEICPGQWLYEPYRGPGHFDLATDLHAGKQAECHIDENGTRTRFVVTGITKLGALVVESVATAEN